jgi:translation elongation factor EF-Ts
LRQEGKPEAMLDNIAKGKLARFFKDNISKPRLYRQQIERC